MKFKTLCKANIFKSGAQVWFLPDKAHCQWSKIIDWYLNFQQSRLQSYKPQKLSPDLLEILTEEEIPVTQINSTDNPPSLISSFQNIPNKQTIFIQFNGNLKAWTDEIFKNWLSLNRPQIRVFLPIKVSAKDFEENWEHRAPNYEIEIVLDK